MVKQEVAVGVVEDYGGFFLRIVMESGVEGSLWLSFDLESQNVLPQSRIVDVSIKQLVVPVIADQLLGLLLQDPFIVKGL